MLFYEISRFGAADSLGSKLLPVAFQGPVDGSGAYLHELLPDGSRDTEGLPGGQMVHLFPQEGAKSFPQGCQKKARISLREEKTSGP
jgi:hypothetical protein